MKGGNIRSEVWTLSGRPCAVVGEQTVTRWVGRGIKRTFDQLTVRYLDHEAPMTGVTTRPAFTRKAKLLKGLQAIAVRRADDLANNGMDYQRARRQALAEIQDGVRF